MCRVCTDWLASVQPEYEVIARIAAQSFDLRREDSRNEKLHNDTQKEPAPLFLESSASSCRL
jgi:hypothetical protein